MKAANASITRRLTASVLLLELLAGLALVAAVAAHERNVQYKAFDANLRGTANALLGAVQEGVNNSVRLDAGDQAFPGGAAFRVTDEDGRLLGSRGDVPSLPAQAGGFLHSTIRGRSYRLFALTGEKVIDPTEGGGIHHRITVLYGLPDGNVWHEVVEAVRFFAICTAVLLGITAWLLVLLIRRFLEPIRALAVAAGAIDTTHWHFEPPAIARHFVEVRPLTSAIEKTIARLQHSFEQQKRFTSDAAHELKTDLAIVKSSLQLLTMKPRRITEYERGLATGLQDLSRLERTLQRMLTLARLEQAQAPGSQRCRMDEVVQTAVQQSLPLADLRSIRMLVSSIAPVTLPLSADDAVLLCSNILLNAIEHTSEHGTIEIHSTAEEGRVHLFVRDHGQGIQTAGALLFEPFYRGDPSRSRKSGGTGLGLSICKAICDRAGGSITIANHPGGGAIVNVTLLTPA